jgi:hypothetical protein
MTAKKPVVFRTKLGTAKGVARSRIWIEGKRLVDAGFTVGKYFAKTPTFGGAGEPRTLETLELELLRANDVTNTAPCKVSGKGDKPIIDITGEFVRQHFGSRGTHVEVTFEKRLITIRPAVDA